MRSERVNPVPGYLQVGSDMREVKRSLGSWMVLRPGNVVYRQLGLAFTYEGGRVAQIMVMEADKFDPLHGDAVVVPGLRAGNLRIGMSYADVQSAWGDPDEDKSVQGKRLHTFRSRGIAVLESAGRVEGMLVYSSDFETSKGVRLGTAQSRVLKIYGKNCENQEPMISYPRRGVGFIIGDGKVIQIQVLARQK
jgi:hypothetical protein